jgi:hypothetical protein
MGFPLNRPLLLAEDFMIIDENRVSMTVLVTIKYENGIMPGAEC